MSKYVIPILLVLSLLSISCVDTTKRDAEKFKELDTAAQDIGAVDRKDLISGCECSKGTSLERRATIFNCICGNKWNCIVVTGFGSSDVEMTCF